MNIDFWLYKIYVALSGDTTAQDGRNADFWAAKIYYTIALGDTRPVPVGRSAEFYLGKFYFYLTRNPASIPYQQNIDNWMRVIYLVMRYGLTQPYPTFRNDRSAEFWARLLFNLIESGNYYLRNPRVNNAVFSVFEDATIGTVVGTVTGSDPDPGNVLTFAIVSGNTGNAFALNANTGVLTVASALNYEVTPSYSLVVRATDNSGLTGTGTITVNVTDVFEPTDIPGLKLWLDSSFNTFQDTAGTIPANIGDPVGYWGGRLGNNYIQATVANKPTRQAGGIHFGLDDSLRNTGLSSTAQNYTLYARINPTDNTGILAYIFDSATGRLICTQLGDTAGRTMFFDGTAWRNIAAATTGLQTLVFKFSGVVGTIYRNGASIGTATYTPKNIGGAIGIGNNNTSNASGLRGTIRLLLLYEGAHDDATRNQIETYISNLPV